MLSKLTVAKTERSGQCGCTGGVGAGVVVGGGGGGGGGGATASAVWMASALTSGWSSTGAKLTTMLEALAITWQASAQAASAMLACKRRMLRDMARL